MAQLKWIVDLLFAGLLFSIGGGVVAGAVSGSHWIVAPVGLLPIAMAIFIVRRRYKIS
ncbi:MAG: hypothetical protein WA064_04720 [Candidatus Moraniibacteriota bacterium]